LRRRAIVGALAASLLAALGVRFSFTARNQPLVERAVVKVSPPTVVDSSPPISAPAPLRDTVTEARDAVASLTSRTADEAMGQTRFLLPIVPGRSIAKMEMPPADTPARPLREAGENFTAGLGPVASSARRAVDLFLRDIPPIGGQGRGGL
jgi:hypothetical protein